MHVAPLQAPDDRRTTGAVGLFFDLSRIEALETVRQEFVANVSHELRTPLTAIKAAALTLLEVPAEGEAGRRFLETIHRNTERMTSLVDDLTDLSLIETGAIRLDIRPVDAAALAQDVVALLAPRYGALNLDVAVDLPRPFTIDADRRRLEQILVNLVDNAMKFNRRGGTVRITGRREDGRTILVVEDSGAGIPSDHLEKVFHRFHRVDPANSRELGGTGLGLAIVKHLVQLHGGAIRVESELGRGSRFTVEL
jgi:two-component system phosphate regulon sensor histidine kinase PhoR